MFSDNACSPKCLADRKMDQPPRLCSSPGRRPRIVGHDGQQRPKSPFQEGGRLLLFSSRMHVESMAISQRFSRVVLRVFLDMNFLNLAICPFLAWRYKRMYRTP
jgi:hypothetical protein